MKTSNKVYKLFGVLLFSVLLLTNCNENEGENITLGALDKSTIENAPLETQIEYANKHLLDIGKIINKMNHNTEFKSILFDNLKKKSNSDEVSSAILVKDLISDIKAKGSATFFISEDDKMSLQQSLEAFYDLEGMDWHPEIIITNFEKKYQKFKSLVEKKTSGKSKPLIVPVVFEDDNENTEDAYDAYQEDENGDLQPTGFKVTQSDAKTKEIIFLKISDSCEAMQQQSNSEYAVPDCDGGGGGGSYKREFYLDRITVKHFKEPVGRPEVNFKTQAYFAPESGPLSTEIFQKFYLDGTHQNIDYIWRRRWVRKKSSRVKNHKYINVDPVPSGSDIYYAVAVAEWDAWPAPKLEVKFEITLPKGNVLKEMMPFYSWQSPYTSGEIKKGIPSWTFNNDAIKYNFKYKTSY